MEWINVKDKLPESYATVLIRNIDGIIKDSYYDAERMLFPICFKCTSPLFEVTHWMPLPQLNPKKD